MLPKFLVIPVLLFALQISFAQETSKLVKVSGEAVGVEQCIRPIDEDRTEVLSKLQFRLRITNVSSQPLIVFRYDPAVFDARLSRTLADIEVGKFAFEQRPPFRVPPPPRNFDDAAPTNEFRILQPSETLTYEPQESLTFLATESIPLAIKPLEGDYFLQLKAATWIWEVEKAERLQQRWARYGNFFYYDVTAEPFSITIPKTGPTTARCNTVSPQ